jgi:hypothetical protein
MNYNKITEAERKRLLEAERIGRVFSIVEELTILFCNSVKYTGVDTENVDPAYITQRLLYNGVIAHVNEAQRAKLNLPYTGWYEAIPVGTRNRWGFPNAYNIGFPNNQGAILTNVSFEEISVIKANPKIFPWYIRFVQDAGIIDQLETSMLVNVDASRNTTIFPVRDETTRNTLERAFDSIRAGASAVVMKDADATMAINNKIVNNTPFEADRIKALSRTVWEEALKRCGIITANNFKRERVQTAEVNAGAGEAIDYIYCMIDTFNEDCTRQGVNAAMEFNGYSAKFDNDGEYENE